MIGNAGAQGPHGREIIAGKGRAILVDVAPAGVLYSESLDLILGQAEDIAGNIIGPQDGPLTILHHHPAGNGLVEPAIALLTAAQRLLGPLELGDVKPIDSQSSALGNRANRLMVPGFADLQLAYMRALPFLLKNFSYHR